MSSIHNIRSILADTKLSESMQRAIFKVVTDYGSAQYDKGRKDGIANEQARAKSESKPIFKQESLVGTWVERPPGSGILFKISDDPGPNPDSIGFPDRTFEGLDSQGNPIWRED